MKAKKVLFITLFISLLSASPAVANNPPGPHIMLAEISILPIMIFLSLAGGAYAVLARLAGKQSYSVKFFAVAGAVLAIFFSGMSEGLGALVALIFMCIAVFRGFCMLNWGFVSLRSTKKPEHLVNAKPYRLIPSGVLLVCVSFFLGGMGAAFVAYWPNYVKEDSSKVETLRQLAAYHLAYAEVEQTVSGQMRFPNLNEDYRVFGSYSGDRSKFRSDYSEDGKHFTIYMLPWHRFPFFPYNYLTSQPSYRADETGQIRMAHVHKGDQICPADAPVVMKVGNEDIQKELSAAKKHIEWDNQYEHKYE
ncbi:MAG: hypothetical protein PVJ11_05015 [Syntrophobacterales bacterium]|jgi:hypothetical protein